MLTPHQFRDILYNLELAIGYERDRPDGGTHSNPDTYPSHERTRDYLNAEKWQDSPRREFPDKRSKAYLLTYLAAGNGESFPALGVPLTGERFAHPDKGVMKVHLEHGHVVLGNGQFCLTDAGRAYLYGTGSE